MAAAAGVALAIALSLLAFGPWLGEGRTARIVVAPDALTYRVVLTSTSVWFQGAGDGERQTRALRIPRDRAVKLILHAQAGPLVLHVPALGVRRQAEPERDTMFWLQATREGTYDVHVEDPRTQSRTKAGVVHVIPPKDG